MTDKEKLEQLLKEFGIGYNLEPFSDHIEDNNITLDEGYGNVEGYSGFYAEFEFDKNGKFKKFGVWE